MVALDYMETTAIASTLVAELIAIRRLERSGCLNLSNFTMIHMPHFEVCIENIKKRDRSRH